MIEEKNINEPQNPAFLVGAVSGSANPNFIGQSLDELFTYRTPQAVIDFINTELIIGNPPFKV